MANFDTIKTVIDANINTNGNQAITGAVMNSVLKQMVDSADTELTELESEVEIQHYIINSVSKDDQGNIVSKNVTFLDGQIGVINYTDFNEEVMEFNKEMIFKNGILLRTIVREYDDMGVIIKEQII